MVIWLRDKRYCNCNCKATKTKSEDIFCESKLFWICRMAPSITIRPLITDYTFVSFLYDGKEYKVNFDEDIIAVEDIEDVFPEVINLILDRIHEFPSCEVRMEKTDNHKIVFKSVRQQHQQHDKFEEETIEVTCDSFIEESSLRCILYLYENVQLTDKGVFKFSGGIGSKLRFEREIEALMRFSNHPNVIDFISCVSRKGKVIGFLTKYEKKGSLRNFLLANLADKERWANQLVEVVKYLHSNGFTHGDIKTDNVVLGDDGNIKLIDFAGGFSEGYSPKRRKYLSENAEDDMYSLGVTLWELFTGKDPREEKIELILIRSLKWRNFIEKCVINSSRSTNAAIERDHGLFTATMQPIIPKLEEIPHAQDRSLFRYPVRD